MKRLITSSTDIYGMARVGYSGDLEVYVNTDDGGKIPHFHLRDKTDWNKFHTCIEILRPKYFHHEGKEDVLNTSERKELQKFIESPVRLKKYASMFENNWQLICFLWDMNNSDITVPDDATMPDYTQLS